MWSALGSRLEAVPWLGLLVADHLNQRPGQYPRPFHVRLVVTKVARGYDFLRVFRCIPVIISPVLHTYPCIINSTQYQQFTAS